MRTGEEEEEQVRGRICVSKMGSEEPRGYALL